MADITLLRKVLSENHVIAMVGLSDKPHRPSYFVGKYLQEHGFKVVPVNPVKKEILGEKCYPSLEEIPFQVDMVDCFHKALIALVSLHVSRCYPSSWWVPVPLHGMYWVF